MITKTKLMEENGMNEIGRNGMIFNFALIPAFRSLNSKDRGDFFLASMEYGAYGTEPDFQGKLKMTWTLIKPWLDSDAKRYQKTLLPAKYAAYKQREKRLKGKKAEILSFNDWKKNCQLA